jgi:tRNA(Arg) A34 adenosine deaminase TadA
MLNLLAIACTVADPTSDKNRKALIGAVAIRQDGTLVKSRNGSTPRPDGISPSCHAEARVLRKAGFGATVYVARVKRDGSLGMAKPCVHCMAALKSRGVEMVYWTVSNNKWEGCRP